MSSDNVSTTGVRQRMRHLLDAYTPSYFPVAWKMGLSISILVLIGMGVLGTFLVNSQVDRMQKQADTFGEAIASQLADSSREPLLAKDSFTLKVLVNNLISDKNQQNTENNSLKGAAIFDKDGKLLQKAGKIPLKTETADAASHTWQQQSHTFKTYTAAVKVKNLTAGHVSVSLSQAPILRAQKEVEKTFITATVLMTLLVIIAAFLVGHWLARPIQDLVAATRAVSSGDLHFRLRERRNDELGQLIDSYNKMASGLLEKDQVEAMLSRFVSPGVARKMMQDIDHVKLGGRDAEATILFADIAGFTNLSEQLPPDEIADLLNDYFNAISYAAKFYRGTIDKYVGDCAMIIFGVPDDDSEHLYHALCCALMTQRLVTCVNQRRAANGQVAVNFRIGINSGKVLAGNLGSNDRMQYTVVGDTVNLASRLSGLAEEGGIILPLELLESEDITSRFRFTTNGTIKIRGKSTPVATANLDGLHHQLETIMEQRISQFVDHELTIAEPLQSEAT